MFRKKTSNLIKHENPAEAGFPVHPETKLSVFKPNHRGSLCRVFNALQARRRPDKFQIGNSSGFFLSGGSARVMGHVKIVEGP